MKKLNITITEDTVDGKPVFFVDSVKEHWKSHHGFTKIEDVERSILRRIAINFNSKGVDPDEFGWCRKSVYIKKDSVQEKLEIQERAIAWANANNAAWNDRMGEGKKNSRLKKLLQENTNAAHHGALKFLGFDWYNNFNSKETSAIVWPRGRHKKKVEMED